MSETRKKNPPERSGADICSSNFLEPDEMAPTTGVFGELNESDFQVGLVCRWLAFLPCFGFCDRDPDSIIRSLRGANAGELCRAAPIVSIPADGEEGPDLGKGQWFNAHWHERNWIDLDNQFHRDCWLYTYHGRIYALIFSLILWHSYIYIYINLMYIYHINHDKSFCDTIYSFWIPSFCPPVFNF